MPLMSIVDDKLGWRNRPGIYQYRHYDRPITITIQQDGSRGVGSEQTNKENGEIWFIGCSHTFGWGLTDGEELSARVADRLDKFTVKNFGVIGYSTLQASMLYQDLKKQSKQNPKLIIYGFSHHHFARNVAAKHWLFSLKRDAIRHNWIKTPYARLNEAGTHTVFPPIEYTKWPLSEYSVILQLLQTTLASFTYGEFRHLKSEAVTFSILSQLNAEIVADDNEFLVLVMQTRPEARQRYLNKFESSNIKYINCPEANYPSEETILSSIDRHPNKIATQRWADCVVKEVKKRQ